ncbi:hypothetical protein BC835DRAFT_1301004, partial [Cytidiella melzeri]
HHASHHLLAIYTMGANKQLLEAAYATHVAYMKPAFHPPEKTKIDTIISDSDWKDHLGDERYYQAYLAFCSAKLTEQLDGQHVLEKFVMSKDANITPGKDGRPPMMLSRFFSGFLHPMIHAGYGAEFDLPGLVAEGLAQAALHPAEAFSLLPETLFQGSGLADVTTKLASTVIYSEPEPPAPHALTILNRVANDPAFAQKALGLPVPRDHPEIVTDLVVRVAGAQLLENCEDWARDLSAGTSAKLLRAKFEEVAWMNTVIYGVGGWGGKAHSADEKKEFNGDFFTMHLVTSALLLPPLLNSLTSASASLLLKIFFAFSLILYITRGRPQLPIADFYKATTSSPSDPFPAPQSAANTLPPQHNPNPWNQIVQTTLVQPNEQLCKVQRASLHFAQVYGGAAPGEFKFTEGSPGAVGAAMTGAEVLDGTLFVRVAKLTADRLGWMREGQASGHWDYAGFFQQ